MKDKLSRGYNQKENHPLWGKHHSPETRAKISKKMKDRKLSLQHRINMSKALTGEKHPCWKGGRKIHHGYAYLWMPDHKMRDKNGYVAEHRIVAEKKLGRELADNEIVHHEDEDTLNNAPENLDVLLNHEHLHLHKKINKEKRECQNF